MKRTQRYEIDIALSYASEDSVFAEALVKALRERKVQYFFEDEEKHTLWGKNLYPYLSDLYQNKARYCVVFISKHYATKRWKSHELEAAQARAFQENEEYILPIRLDDTQLPGILPTTGYLDWPPETAETVADIILKKLGREPYQPPKLSVSEEITSITSQQTAPIVVHGKRGQKGENAEDAVLQTYIEKIEEKFQEGNATELTYRSPLEELLKKFVPEITVTHEAKREAYGSPDYVISQKTGHGLLHIGYVEAKKVNVNLDEIERDAALTEPKTHDGKQLKKYREALPNLILTNYLEFRWYIKGEHRMTARLISPVIDKGLPAKKGSRKNAQPAVAQLMLGIHAQSTIDVARLLAGFLTYNTEPISNPKELAERMARITHIIRDMTIISFEENEIPDTLRDLYEAFKDVLIPDLTVPYFADMFAQTLAYGLFAARYNHRGSEPFRRQDAAREIPNTNPFLAELFEKITGRSLDDVPFIGFVDDLAQLLAQTDMNAVLANFGKHTRREDPLIHFYETFLTEYDPKLRELRGVYYTPEPVISYMVRSVDAILRNQFDCKDGLADTSKIINTYTDENGDIQEKSSHRVLLLDPACGTGTFPYAVINHIRETYRRSGNAGLWSSYVREHLLPRIFGFELLMAPYAMAHLKLGMQLAALDLPEAEQNTWSYDFKSNERLGLYLTNSLEQAIQRSNMLFARYISDEANAAYKVKKDYPVMVVLGNPPYSYESANTGDWIGSLVRDYYFINGRSIGERNPKGLQDDYVKFIRFAQWRIEQTGYGILAFITNHGYLNNPTFSGMRYSLMQSFDQMYFLDLHGGSKPKEIPPSGIIDKNVFDIQTGVSIGIFVKHNNTTKNAKTISYAELWGTRESKYNWLSGNEIGTTQWLNLAPRSPNYYFIPQERDRAEEYEKGFKITEIMPTNSVGLYTARDDLAIQRSKHDLDIILKDFISLPVEEARTKYNLGKDSRDWKVDLAQKDIRDTKLNEAKAQKIAYRPFDTRFTYYTGRSRGLICMPRSEVMNNIINKHNLVICFMRRSREQVVSNFFVAKHIVDKTILSSADNANVAPLYIYPDSNTQETLFSLEDMNLSTEALHPNLSPEFVKQMINQLKLEFVFNGKGDLKKTFGPEDIFSYMYAIFYSPTYRERYTEFLKSDFPRLPLTSNAKLFSELCIFGEKLVKLHLMEIIGQSLPSYPIRGDNRVDLIRYTEPFQSIDEGCVWINKTQYFKDIPPEVWHFYIGGYQVCQKWLKDLKDHNLSYEEILHYQQIVANLKETILLMEKIDEAIDEYGGWPIE